MGHYTTRVIRVSIGRYCKSGVVGIMPLPIIKQKKQRNCSLASQTRGVHGSVRFLGKIKTETEMSVFGFKNRSVSVFFG
ncbi:hypothetical protein Hanom_Chr10g00881091 [Helianthus anomalus]